MKRLDLIIDTLDYLNKFTNIDVAEALAAARSLRDMKPVAWVSESPTRGNGKRLFFTENEAYRYASNYQPLYALGDEK